MKRLGLFERQSAPCLVTARLEVRLAAVADAVSLAVFFKTNEAHFKPWDPPSSPARFTAAHWDGQIRRSLEDWRADRALRFHVFLLDDPHQVIGRIGFSQIFRGPFHSCMLGYQIGEEHQGRGLMFEALEASVDYMFNTQKLHRIQANYIPSNVRSATLLKRLGFVEEGLSKNYLFIDGAWRDHVLTARLNPGFDASTFQKL